MEALQFCYWLKGFLELSSNQTLLNLDHEQIQIINDHLDLVFTKVTPDRSTAKLCNNPYSDSITITPERLWPVMYCGPYASR